MEIPERMKHLPRFGKYPLFYVVGKNRITGEPNFRNQDRNRQVEAGRKFLCHLCGQKLEIPFYFVIPEDVFKSPQLMEGPMHLECVRYAAATCPYLVNPEYRLHRIKDPKSKEQVKHNLETAGSLRPAKMAIVGTDTYEMLDRDPETNKWLQYPVFYPGQYLSVDWDTIPERTEPARIDSGARSDRQSSLDTSQQTT